ncbi:MAG: hypothetical protein GEV10_24695 [Streptosporangiales bacterium]|nr:hypothetical protein [Streptosporangiales bacterium]
MMGTKTKAIVTVVALACACGVPAFLPAYQVTVATTTAIFAIFALGLSLPMRHGGLPSLGHAAFYGVGGYAVALLTLHGVTNMALSILVAVAASTLFALVVGPILLRTRADYFLMATLAVGQILFNLTQRFTEVTGGENGITGMTAASVFGVNLGERTNFYYLSLVTLVAVAILVGALARAPFGHLLRAGRDSAKRTSALGVNVYRTNLTALLWSAPISGLAGALASYQSGFVTPEAFSVATSGAAFLMVAVGGPAFVAGPILGAIVIEGLSGVLSLYTDRTNLILGLVYVVIALRVWRAFTKSSIGKRVTSRVSRLVKRRAEPDQPDGPVVAQQANDQLAPEHESASTRRSES